MIDLVSQVKTANLLMNFLQGNLERITPYPFQPYPGRQEPDPELYGMERSTPEAQGVLSRTIADFFAALRDCPDIHVHSVAILRHGKLITEGSFRPYSSGCPHMMFSLSKSVVGMAVGMAVEEGLFRADDRISDLFPEWKGLFRSAKLGAVTVRHLLTMTSDVKYNEVFSETDKDWVKGFLASDCYLDPGSEFHYNSMNSYMLAALVCKKSGLSLVDYLMPRLFEPLGIPRPRWETSPTGIEKGGWGLYLRTIDMLKLGQLYLQHGSWTVKGEKRQLVPESWVRESTEHFIPTNAGPHLAGYGYQLWSFPAKGAYQFNGVFGQYVFVLPERDMVIAITSGSGELFRDSSCAIVEQFFGDDAEPFAEMHYPEDVAALRKLITVLDSLSAATQQKTAVVPAAKQTLPRRFLTFLKKKPEQGREPQIPALAAAVPQGAYRLEPGFGSLMPLILQGFTNNVPKRVETVRFSFLPGVCRCVFGCGETLVTLDAGLGADPIRSWIPLNGEDYFVGASAELVPDEDGRPVLKLHIHFLQAPSLRSIKFIFFDGGKRLFARFDELPSVSTASEMLFSLVDGSGNGLQKLMIDSITQHRLRERVSNIMRPRVKGALLPAKDAGPSLPEPEKEPG